MSLIWWSLGQHQRPHTTYWSQPTIHVHQARKAHSSLFSKQSSEIACPPLTSKSKHANCGVIQIVQKSRQRESPEVPSTKYLRSTIHGNGAVTTRYNRKNTLKWKVANPQPCPGLSDPNVHAPSPAPQTPKRLHYRESECHRGCSDRELITPALLWSSTS